MSLCDKQPHVNIDVNNACRDTVQAHLIFCQTNPIYTR